MIFHVAFGTAILSAAIHLLRQRGSGLGAPRVVEILLLHLLAVAWGIWGVLLSLPHILMPDPIAESIGWAPGSPFQVELGYANLGMSVVAVLCIWHRGWFWLAPIVAKSVFLLGAAAVHIEDIVKRGNLSPGNAGPVLFYDILVPMLTVTLFVAYMRQGGAATQEPRRD